jgi:hypothetical protein
VVWQPGYGLVDLVIEVPFPEGIFLSCTTSAIKPASYLMRTGLTFPWVKLPDRVPIVPRLRMRGALFPLPPTTSWRIDSLSSGTILRLMSAHDLLLGRTYSPSRRICFSVVSCRHFH